VKYDSAKAAAWLLLQQDDFQAEIARLRMKAQDVAGPAVMTLIEKRSFLARVVRARPTLLEEDSDLWQSISHTHCGHIYRLPDKIQVIVEDNKLSGDGSEAAAYDSLTLWLGSLRG
jgi:hypothetical protein